MSHNCYNPWNMQSRPSIAPSACYGLVASVAQLTEHSLMPCKCKGAHTHRQSINKSTYRFARSLQILLILLQATEAFLPFGEI